MSYTFSDFGFKRFFSVPCALVDSYLKLADGPALKVILYLLSCEGCPGDGEIMAAAGISREALEDAVMFWREVGVLTPGGAAPENTTPHAPKLPEKEEESKQIPPSPPQPQGAKVVHASYAPKDIADMLKKDGGLKELFTEAEKTLGRILRHADHETLISLRDYYGFDEPSVVLILSYCFDIGKTSARYYESVAKGLFEKGITEFHAIESEFERMKEAHSFENEIRRDFGLNTKLSSRQSETVNAWRSLGFGMEMISLAREKCVDNLNKLSFPYIDKILRSWAEKGIFTPEAAKNEPKPRKAQPAERSFDIDEFESFTLGGKKEDGE